MSLLPHYFVVVYVIVTVTCVRAEPPIKGSSKALASQSILRAQFEKLISPYICIPVLVDLSLEVPIFEEPCGWVFQVILNEGFCCLCV